MKRKLLPILLAVCMLSCAIFINGAAEQLSQGTALLAKDAELIKSSYFGETATFCENDFLQALGTDDLDSITVVSLPEENCGSLFLASARVSKGQNISAAVLGHLKFVPGNESVSEACFSFTADNLAGGSEIPCRIRFLDKKNEAPTAHDGASLSVSTQKGISYFGTMEASDPENDALTFRITSYPSHGTLTLLDASTGEYRYTPTNGFTGKDVFSFVVRDEYGNYSRETEIGVTVNKRSSSLVYEDVAGTATELSAVYLTDAGILLGRLSGDGMYFDPQTTVTRGDFTVMAMKAAGIAPRAGLTNTYFDDDSDIPSSIKGYIATAQALGYVNGTFDGTGLYFEANRAVTRAEAAVILCNVMKLSAGDSAAVFADKSDDVPVWAESAVTTLYTLGVMQAAEGSLWNADEALTRADAANMIYKLMQ